ncbi:TetR family transcriptional regulator [Zunongwangia sp. HGR-M22]|uniref:TetR family transcriptional regulator n=1 Tax=Zunongwangia sp. HGR-M22 TaxID=3015168 RepID=UPI0022DDA1BF|nr:TetR family transcriptional regulator [Zunongwangia sp. HGR-M22]WBL26383.1 TetR family transcriptional regulator [Zunongwangia sp. HGR-M22]
MELSEKQLEILKVAEELFSKNGFDGTSVRAIAKMANINIAMISYYFGSKEKLLETLVSYRISNFQVAVGQTIESESTYIAKIDAVIALLITRIHEGRKIHKLVHFEFSREDKKIDFTNYLKKKDENIQLFTNLIKEGQADGAFSKNVDVELIVPTILGTYFNLYYNKKIYAQTQGLFDEESFDHFVLNNLTQHIQRTIKALLTYEA